MTAILGIFGDSRNDDEVVAAMLSAMSPVSDSRSICRAEGAVLAFSSPLWQRRNELNNGDCIAARDGISVVADASLYYRADLRRALSSAGVTPISGDGSAQLILAAYQAWGEKCVDHLEGDWAFLLWDARTRRALCARDFAGRRRLYYSSNGESFVLASSIPGVLAHPRCSSLINLVSVAESMSGFFASSHQTCYRDIESLQAGHSLQWQRGRKTIERHWNPAPREDRHGLPFEEGAVHLHDLLQAAIEERLAPDGLTTIQLSGGWDSSSLFGVGSELLAREPSGRALSPVSISYPPGDPGREDEIIDMILGHWGASTHWISSGEIPLFSNPAEAGVRRDEPFAHVYEYWNQRLVQEARALGSTIMFDGFGGDSLFHGSPVYFADLLKSGRLIELRREWKSKRMAGRQAALTWLIQPLLPSSLLHFLQRMPGGAGIEVHLERKLPSWIDRGFAKRWGLVDRERQNTPRYGKDTAASDELFWHVTNPWITRMLAENYRIGMLEGVELRSPLFDRRVVEFALGRPWQERAYRRETKLLLRRSVKGLLPDDVLAPRRYRTGLTTGFLERHMTAELPRIRDDIVGNTVLADLGVVDRDALNQGIETYLRQPNAGLAVQLFFGITAEFWMRAHASSGAETNG